MGQFLRKYANSVGFIGVLVLAFFFRLYSLGYSNFQGDEVSAQNYLFGRQNFWTFLLSRTVGPGQFLISFIANSLAGNASSKEFWVRLPFCAAGIVSCIAVYFLVKRHLGKTPALFSFLLVSMSGLLIAFSRIVQYQSFVILLSALCVYLVFEYQKIRRSGYLIAAGVLSGMGLLFHYDFLAFLIPLTLLLLKNHGFKTSLKLFVLPMLFTSGLFYLPYITSAYFKGTVNYLLEERISSNFNFDSIYYSYKLFTLYHPKELTAFVLLVTLGGIFYSVRKAKSVLIVSALLLIFILARFLLVKPFTPIIYSSLIVSTILLVVCYKKLNSDLKSFLGFWALFAFIVYGLLIRMPLTHIYTFIFPMLIVLGIFLGELAKRSEKTTYFVYLAVLVVTIYTCHYNYQAFINIEPEFPWNAKTYLGGKMPAEIVNGEEIKGVFGFPYNRWWKNIAGDLTKVKAWQGYSTYSSNEKYRMTKYYIRDFKWQDAAPDVYIWVDKPQSLVQIEKPRGMIIKETENYIITVSHD